MRLNLIDQLNNNNDSLTAAHTTSAICPFINTNCKMSTFMNQFKKNLHV